MPPIESLWLFLLPGYLATVLVETPVLCIGLSRVHSWQRRLLAGVWLTACTYPIVALVLPIVLWEPFSRTTYLVVAETFAPLAECALFYFAFHDKRQAGTLRDFSAIILANLTSFVVGEILVARLLVDGPRWAFDTVN